MPGGYGSWNIIGWFILAIPLLLGISYLFAKWGAWLAIQIAYINWRWHLLLCEHGRHSPTPHGEKLVEEYQEPMHNDYIFRQYQRNRCRYCMKEVGTRKLLKEKRVSMLELKLKYDQHAANLLLMRTRQEMKA